MRRGSVRRPAPGTVLGVIAVVISLCGSAYAVSLARNSVKSKHIAKNAVKGKDAKESTFGTVPRATNAATAQTAVAAGLIDGHDAECPPATFLQNGACFDNAERFPAIDWTGAAQACADAGGYLPSTSELLSIRNASGVDLGPTGDGHWADARYEDSGGHEAMTVLDNGTLEADLLIGPNPVRCAFKLVR